MAFAPSALGPCFDRRWIRGLLKLLGMLDPRSPALLVIRTKCRKGVQTCGNQNRGLRFGMSAAISKSRRGKQSLDHDAKLDVGSLGSTRRMLRSCRVCLGVRSHGGQGLVPLASGMCLSNGIPPADRKLLAGECFQL